MLSGSTTLQRTGGQLLILPRLSERTVRRARELRDWPPTSPTALHGFPVLAATGILPLMLVPSTRTAPAIRRQLVGVAAEWSGRPASSSNGEARDPNGPSSGNLDQKADRPRLPLPLLVCELVPLMLFHPIRAACDSPAARRPAPLPVTPAVWTDHPAGPWPRHRFGHVERGLSASRPPPPFLISRTGAFFLCCSSVRPGRPCDPQAYWSRGRGG